MSTADRVSWALASVGAQLRSRSRGWAGSITSLMERKWTVDRAKRDWSWIKEHMPELALEIAEWRAAGHGAHVDLCWKRGVLEGQPNYFFAQEGPLAVGTRFTANGPVLENINRRSFKVEGYVLQLAPLEMADA